MNNKWIKNTAMCAVIFSLLLPSMSASAEGETASHKEGNSPVAAAVEHTKVNPDYEAWVANGCSGMAPPAQDFSYLAQSYAESEAPQSRASVRLPSRYDLRAFNQVDGVIDQKTTGLCWSIAANSAAAGSIRDAYPLLTLSPLHTAWFCYTGKEEHEFAPDADPIYSGGNDGRAVATMAAWKGPVRANRAPFNPNRLVPPDEDLRHVADFHLQDAFYMPNGIYHDPYHKARVSTEVTKQVMMDVGPVTLNYHAHGKDAYNPKTYACYNSRPAASDHAVLIVGWDDNFSRTKFNAGNQPAHDGAWLVRNSWGPYWGNNGYFWISYEDRSLVSGNAYLLEEQTNYTRNYQYDLNGWAFSTSTNSAQPKQATAANIFTAQGNEQLEAVSFYTTDANTRYSISIYTDVQPGAPQSGQCALAGQTGQEPYAGYHTIELTKPIKLEQGRRFSIVVSFENPHYNLPLAIEWCPMGSGMRQPAAMGHGGESYVLKDQRWQDVAGPCNNGYYVTNVCIKGFTNPLPWDGVPVSKVRFSKPEGAVGDNPVLTLSAGETEQIFWRSGSGDYQPYTGPIDLQQLPRNNNQVTISAFANNGMHSGYPVQKSYAFTDQPIYTMFLDAQPTHGQVTMPYSGCQGGTYTFVVATPDPGYRLSKLIVLDEDGHSLSLSNHGGNKYGFTMPHSTVKIIARFEQKASVAPTGLPFEDVQTTDWFYQPVKYVYSKQLMMGTTDSTFAPTKPVNRAMVWSVLARLSGDSLSAGPYWYSGAQQWAIAHGVSDGTHPLNPVTREQLVSMLYRAADAPSASVSLAQYADENRISPWAKDAMMWAVDCHLISGLTENTLGPQNGASRAEQAAMLTRFSKDLS